MTSISTAAETDKAMTAHALSRMRGPRGGRRSCGTDPIRGRGKGTVRIRIGMSNTYPIRECSMTLRESARRAARVLRTAQRPVGRGAGAPGEPCRAAAPNE
ncbi:hypothetical protein KNE206_27050 [Kitasatospora sp. NE20-6]